MRSFFDALNRRDESRLFNLRQSVFLFNDGHFACVLKPPTPVRGMSLT